MSVGLILGETLQQRLEEPWMVTLYALHEHCISILCVFGVGVCVFRFFFSLHVNSNLIWFTVQGTKITIYLLFITVYSTVHILKNIKNESHDTIHTFKNYFVTVLLVFSFQFSVSAIISSIQTDPLRSMQLKMLLSHDHQLNASDAQQLQYWWLPYVLYLCWFFLSILVKP